MKHMTTHKRLSILTIFNFLYFVFFFFILHLTIPANSLDTNYTLTENIFLDCGSQGTGKAFDRREWIGDIGSKFTPLESSITTKASPQGSSIDPVPYLTARISHSQFTYTFPVTPGQKFIRLYFFSTSYQGFNKSNAFFSVKTGRYTLLNNFSASLTAQSLGREYFFREFCVNVEEESTKTLSLTFTPSTSFNEAYAFINGIEIVSMPTNLYYTPPGGVGLLVIGTPTQLEIGNQFALETVYRLNVGGRFISPMTDSGLFRSWYDDDKYVQHGVLPVNTSIHINYKKTEPYTAPEEVYQTARSMGTNRTINEGYNLTWMLPVDSNFKYLVRLHFCEFQSEIKKTADRLFQVFITNQTAQDVDIIFFSGGPGIPIFKDYVVQSVEREGGQDRRDIFIALHPKARTSTQYSDAILNGIELFKLSNPDNNLAGPNPTPLAVAPPSQPPTTSLKNPKSKTIISVIVSGGVMGVLVVLCLGFYIAFRRRRGRLDSDKGKSTRTNASSLPEELCRHFSIPEIRTATNNFDEKNVIGVGGFGKVFKGCIDDGDTKVAIKRLSPGSKQGLHEFMTEIELLSQLRHVHLVSLIGYCNDQHEMILVYNYMDNGTLRDHLYGTDNDPLTWKQRLQICIGSAKGLHYLHTGAKHTIIHRDVKSTNILLDEKWVAKVADFGLSKMGSTSIPNAAVSTAVKGTLGYLDPEYLRRLQLTEKSDVYSFGVVLLEVLCARKVVDHTAGQDRVNLAHWVKSCIRKRTLDQIIDPFLMGKIAPECLRTFVDIAQRCLLEHGIQRPSMSDVVGSLEFALKLQETAEAAKQDIGAVDGFEDVDNIYPEAALSTVASSVLSRDSAHVLDSRSDGFTDTTTNALSNFTVDSDTVTSGDVDTITTNSNQL
uniref:Protein kinase domain-containing protein n=1 Tax=Davidia involucrata TaxID=16924 RepID=A0A5B7A965_DAVIN